MTADQAFVVVVVLLWMFLVSCGAIEFVCWLWRKVRERWHEHRDWNTRGGDDVVRRLHRLRIF